jgi:hypothetical protein
MTERKGGLSVHEAAAALREVEQAGRRTQALTFSAAAGPQVMAWGVIWLVCNSFVQFGPPWAPAIWLPGVVLGTGLSIWLARRCGGVGWDLRRGATFLAIIGFVNALILGLAVTDPAQCNYLISLVVAVGYILAGLWRSGRLAWAGLVLAVLVLVGWWAVHPWFTLWMGVVGGGTLILTGLWLRRL